MRLVVLCSALVPVLLVAGCGSDGPATTSGDAACAAPSTIAAESTVAPGQTVRVQAEGLWSSCRDHGVVDEDGDVQYPDPEPAPLTNLQVRFAQGDAVTDLATVDADDAARVELDVTIPADAAAGPAEITVGRLSSPATVTVVTDGAASPSTSP